MSDKLKQFKWLIVLFLFLLAIPSYFAYNHFRQSSTLKEAFEKNERIEVLHHLMASGKYASDIRKAGYTIPSDGAIRLDGGIDSIGIKGDIDLKMSNPRRDEVSVLFATMVNEEKINVYYILDHQFTLKRSYYSYISNQKKEDVNISQVEEERLLKIVRKELKAFLDKMYQTLYG
jgi:hypothetical protein